MTDKKFEDLTPEDAKELKIEFAPGCFDGFEGSQEELDALIGQIKEMFASGEALEKARKIDFDDIDDEDLELLARAEQHNSGRTLQ